MRKGTTFPLFLALMVLIFGIWLTKITKFGGAVVIIADIIAFILYTKWSKDDN